jgi:ribose/xylose/arabinose/galactoside ABC-type transport system permease subunit
MTKNLLNNFRIQDDFILILCFFYYILVSLLAPGFFSFNNNFNLLLNLLPILIVAIGQTYVILTAGIDLSVTSTIALTSIAGGYVMSADSALGLGTGLSIFLGILLMLLIGFLIGLFNGFAITKLGMPAFMVTLTVMMFMSGFAIWLTKSQNIYNLTDAFVELPYSSFVFIPIPLIMGSFVALLAHLILTKTLRGEWIYAVGLNPKVANISGVKVNQTIIFTYIFSGICAALASVLYTARLETGSPVMGQNILLDVIGAVIIGGTSLFGGKGKIKWTIYGVLFITLVDNSLNIMGLPYFLIMIVKGLLIIFAAIFNILKERKSVFS